LSNITVFLGHLIETLTFFEAPCIHCIAIAEMLLIMWIIVSWYTATEFIFGTTKSLTCIIIYFVVVSPRVLFLSCNVYSYTGWAKKTGPFLNVDNFATVSGRKACNMSKVCKSCLEKSAKLAYQCV